MFLKKCLCQHVIYKLRIEKGSLMKYTIFSLKGFMLLIFISTYYPMLAFTQNPKNSGSKEMQKITEYQIFKVHGLNSEYADFSPVIYKQDFIFASNRQYNFNIIGEDNWSKTNHMNIFKAEVRSASSDSIIATRVKIFDKVFLDNDHTGPICFSADGTEAIFTKVSHRKQSVFGDKTARPQLYSAKLEGGKWTKVEKLPFVKINFSYGHPSLSADGKTLYYVSDELGGSGGKDIWVVERNGETWSDPKALRELNTSGDELFPSIVDDVLYFSSNGRGGKGGLDLFVSKRKNTNWQVPESLGETINTEFDEFGMVFNSNKQSGYFSSNRSNGDGDDDIYFFKVNEKVIVEDDVIEGQFVYKKLRSDIPLGLDVVLLDEDENVVMQTKTDANGEFKFRNLDADKKYVIRLMKDGEEVELILYGKEANSFLLANNEGDFVYRKLSSNSVGTISLIDEENVDPITRTGTMNGQFVYSKLNSDAPSGVDVYLIDEEGNIVDRTKTDINGNFQFSKLSMEKNYRVKIGDLEDDVNLLVFNKKNQVTAVLASGKDGIFEYRKLKTENSNDIDFLLLEEANMQFADNSMILSGEFLYRKLGSKISNMEYEILDEKYSLITKGKTNDVGFFREMYIPAKDQVIFKINGNDYPEEVDLIILDRTKQVVVKLDKNNEGYFVYKKLSSSSSELSIEDEMINSLKGKGINGQFVFEKLSPDKSNDYEIYDENGTLIHKGKTDNNGFVSLIDLDPNSFYQFKLLGYGNEADLRVWDSEKEALVLIKKSKNGFYEFGKKSALTSDTKPDKPIKTPVEYASGKLIQAIYYEQDVYKIGGDSRIKALEVVKFMNDNPTAKIVVASHTSSVGVESYNNQLSKKRMQTIIDFLIEKGISADRIIGEFHGESKPKVDCGSNCTEKDNANNRRTEITLIK